MAAFQAIIVNYGISVQLLTKQIQLVTDFTPLRSVTTALLVVMGVNEDREKVLLGMREGYRESTESWKELLRDLKKRGLNETALAVADGSLGFWGALSEIYPATRHQRCLKHKWVNVLDKLPKAKQKEALSRLREIYQARSRKEAIAL